PLAVSSKSDFIASSFAPYLIFARHSFRRSSSERTCVSIVSCSALMPLLDNSADAFLSRFCLQSRMACLVALWASDVALRYSFMQASAIEHVWHSWAAAGLERSRASIAVRTLIAHPPRYSIARRRYVEGTTRGCKAIGDSSVELTRRWGDGP